jgi:hypothetical protein
MESSAWTRALGNPSMIHVELNRPGGEDHMAPVGMGPGPEAGQAAGDSRSVIV